MSGDNVASRARQVLDTLVAPERENALLAGAAGIEQVLDVSVTEETATVRVRIPAPSDSTRARIKAEFREVVLGVEGVDDLAITWGGEIPDPGRRVEALPGVKHVVAVASGKGGVGKSTIATNLAVTLADGGADVGLLDADIHGPNAPKLLGLSDWTPETTLDDEIRPRTAHGVSVMSMDFIVGQDDPIIWRGVLVDESLKQFLDDVAWGSLDYLVVDLPPGTGDAHLTMVQYLPISGAVIVTTPQPVAVDDAERALRGFDQYDVPVVGIVENMSGYECPDCGSTHDIFGTGGARALGEKWNVPVIGQLPLDPSVHTSRSDDGASPPGIDVPLLGRLRVPQTRKEREQTEETDPVAVRNGDLRQRLDLIAARTATHLASHADNA
ncbi:MAG: Mrp/NBP35 family ATP-binding protein [Halapricum sp.]